MKILLIATNQADRFMDRMVVRPVPIGLAYLAASVDEERHTLRVLDLMFADDAVSQVADAVSEFEPDIIGLSIRNLDNQSSLNPMWNLPAVRDIIERIRQISAAKMLVGGPAFSILPSECLDYVGADLGIAGDAAEAFATLVERIDNGADYRDIPGIVYRDDANDGQIVVSEGRFTSNFHRSPRLDLLDMRAYNGSGFGVGVVTKLAQSYSPTPGANYSGDDWRIRDPQEVVDEIRALDDDFSINKVFFIDSGFNIPAEHAKATCRAIIDAGVRVRWNSYVRPSEDADAELMSLMKQSGCSLALMAEGGRGGEGLVDRLAGLERMADLCRGAGLPFTMNVTFGEPDETKASVERKLDFLKRVKSVFAVLRVGTRILPNTAVAQTALAEGQIASESELMQPTFYIEPQVRDWLADHLCEAATDYPRWNLM
ncbi:MAG: hypothetical protein F4Y44_08500 [Chloroflexi bacterium]|nr:hypothetical protein [Chloroflexota bacterium]